LRVVSVQISVSDAVLLFLDNVRADGLIWANTLAGAADALRTTQLREIQFSGGLVYNESGFLVIDRAAGDLDWVGEPSPEIDALVCTSNLSKSRKTSDC
jgi:hypothetical protein